jgi:hypothetical protein
MSTNKDVFWTNPKPPVRPLPTTTLQLIEVLKRVELRDFTQGDWQAFAGCESRNPKIGELDNLIVIVDGNDIQVAQAEDDNWIIFTAVNNKI